MLEAYSPMDGWMDAPVHAWINEWMNEWLTLFYVVSYKLKSDLCHIITNKCKVIYRIKPVIISFLV